MSSFFHAVMPHFPCSCSFRYSSLLTGPDVKREIVLERPLFFCPEYLKQTEK